MQNFPYQPLVPGLDLMEGLYVAQGATSAKIKIGAGMVKVGDTILEQTEADAANTANEITISGLADGTYLVYANHPDAKNASDAALGNFSVNDKEHYEPVVNIINNTKGEMVGRSRVIASITVASAALTEVSNAARFALDNFQGTYTATMPGGTPVSNNNLAKS